MSIVKTATNPSTLAGLLEGYDKLIGGKEHPACRDDDRSIPMPAYNDVPTKPIKVAMVAACPFPANHGTPGAIRELALHLARQGHEVHVVTYPQGEAIPTEGIHIHRVRIPFFKPGPVSIGPSLGRLFYDALLVPKLVQVIRRHRLEVIHAHNYEANIAGALAKWLTGCPLIYNGVTAMADELPSYRFIRPDSLARAIGRLLDRVVPRLGDILMVLSDELKDYLVQLGNSDEKVLVVPPGVEIEWLASGESSKVRSKLGLGPEVPIVMYTGALETFQRIDYLLQAMAVVCTENSRAMLVIVVNIKNTKALEHYQSMAGTLGIGDRVRFVESVPLEELPDYLAAADVTVIPRPFCPGYPIKLLNYMAAGKPTVSFAGSAKSLYHGYSGYIAANADIDDLARGIKMFLNDPELSKMVGLRARHSLEGVLEWPTVASGVAAVYAQVRANQRRFSRAALAKYLKRSYTPLLEQQRQITPFLKDGKLVYPSLLPDKPWQQAGTEDN